MKDMADISLVLYSSCSILIAYLRLSYHTASEHGHGTNTVYISIFKHSRFLFWAVEFSSRDFDTMGTMRLFSFKVAM